MNKILFFIRGACPTDSEREQAAAISGRVVFRNAQFADSESCEQCDSVAGLVPANYAALFPVVDIAQLSEKPRRGRPPKAAQDVPTWEPN